MLTDSQLHGWTRLTPRQRQCVEALRTGYCSDKAVARKMGVEVNTVSEHLAQARAILGVHHRVELALIAERIHVHGLAPRSEPWSASGVAVHRAGARPEHARPLGLAMTRPASSHPTAIVVDLGA